MAGARHKFNELEVEMIDINELRRLAQAATPGPWKAVSELLDRLEAAEAEALEEARLNGMGSEREAALLAKLEAAEKERDWHAGRCEDAMNECAALHAKIEAMERQEPVGEIQRANSTGNYICSEVWVPLPVGSKLYALPGAQPAPSFADAYQGAMEEVAIWKKRALEAEDLNRKFVAEINGPTYMGDPAHSKPDCGEAGHDEGRCGNKQCLPGAQPAPSVPDGVAEALQRLIENGAVLGPASSEDALLVARYRQRLLACAPSVPTESIGKMLAQAMDAAVANGANSVSMPDELVEVAAWLSGVQPNPANGQTRAVRDVIAERRRQIEVEGWAPEHDDRHGAHELAEAAACYCLSSAGKPFDYFETMWPWERWWFKVSDPRRDLVKAGALVLAEIERLDRAEAPKQEGE